MTIPSFPQEQYSYNQIHGKRQGEFGGSFFNLVGKTVVHERNSDTWEFGKGALSANDIFLATTPGQPERLQT
jgi:hypothetical protein